MSAKIRIAVLGASGYTGADLVRLAITHPMVEIAALAANQKAGQTMADIWPSFAAYRDLPRLIRADAIDWRGIDAVFGCLPHAASAELLSTLDARIRITDLSADFRLNDPEIYGEGYGVTHLDVVDRSRMHGASNYGIFDRGLQGILDLFGVWWLKRRIKRLPVASEIGNDHD